MNSAERQRKRSLRGQEGLVAAYRPYFSGEGRVIALQGLVAFIAGLCEALLLVVVAKLAFSIGGEANDTVDGVGPFDALTLGTRDLFAIAFALAVGRAAMQALVAHLAAGLISRRMSILRAGTFQDYSVASWAKQASMDEASVQDLLVRYVTKLISALVVLSVTFGTSFTLLALLGSAVLIDPLAAVLVVATGLVLFVALRPLSKLAKRYAEMQVIAGRRYVQTSLEAIGMSLEIRSFGVNDEVAARLATATEAETRPIYMNQLLQRLVTAVYQFSAVSVVLAGLFAVDALVDRPLASLGAIVIILVRSMSQASTVQSAYHTAVETAPFARMLTTEREELRASAPVSGSVPPPERSTLVFDEVSYSYGEEGASPFALDRVSFQIEPGEAIGVIGPSGSGKSTLIQLLMRLREPTDGTYLIGGVDTREIDERAWFDQIAFVPQDCHALNSTIRDNIRFFRPHLSDEVVVDAARRAHLHAEIEAMPAGYDTELGSRGGSLSGGQRQRLAIARALASGPRILVLDEPTSALDMRSESLVHQTLTDLQGSVTLVIIAHRLSTLKTCDRIMVFGHGELQGFGERAELEAHNEFYRDALALSKLRS